MNRTRMSYAFGIVALALLFIWGTVQNARNDRLASVTSFSPGSSGTEIFTELLRRTSPDDFAVQKTAYLDKEAVEEFSTVLLFGPTATVTEREASILAEFVKSGGTLLLSFHNEATETNAKHVLKALGIDLATKEAAHFVDRQGVTVRPAKTSALFRESEGYVFYSSRVFDRAGCTGNEFECFVHEQSVGEGTVTIFAGFPPLINPLIGKGSNPSLAAALLTGQTPILIDEYHHFFTEKSLGDLFLLPSFSVPIFGMVLTAILFFLFGAPSAQLSTPDKTVRRSGRSYHQMNELILSGLLRQDETLEASVARLKSYLLRTFPNQRERIERAAVRNEGPDQSDILRHAKKLFLLHRELLQQKAGGLKDEH